MDQKLYWSAPEPAESHPIAGAKATAPSSDLELIKEYYNYNEQRAREVLDLLSESEIQNLRLKLSKGGTDDIAIPGKSECR